MKRSDEPRHWNTRFQPHSELHHVHYHLFLISLSEPWVISSLPLLYSCRRCQKLEHLLRRFLAGHWQVYRAVTPSRCLRLCMVQIVMWPCYLLQNVDSIIVRQLKIVNFSPIVNRVYIVFWGLLIWNKLRALDFRSISWGSWFPFKLECVLTSSADCNIASGRRVLS